MRQLASRWQALLRIGGSFRGGCVGVFAAAVPHIPANRMVLGSRLCSWSDLAADALRECRFVRLLVCVLLQHVLAAGVETLVIPFSSAGNGGNPPRIAESSDHGARRRCDGGDQSAWSSKALGIFNWALIWPAWYVVAIAWRQSQEGRTGPFAGQGQVTVPV